jgi:hypothetical protein
MPRTCRRFAPATATPLLLRSVPPCAARAQRLDGRPVGRLPQAPVGRLEQPLGDPAQRPRVTGLKELAGLRVEHIRGGELLVHPVGDHAGGGGEQRADEDNRIGKAAAHGAEQLPDGVEQVLRHAGSFEYQAHEGEERNRQQSVIAHHAIDAFRQGLQEVGDEQAKLDTEQREDQPTGAEREGRRITEQQKKHQGAEHDRRHIVDEESVHARP